MIHLNKALAAWGQKDFQAVLRSELERLPHDTLPLQEGLRYSSYVSEEPFQVMLIRVNEERHQILVMARLFYSGIIAGCSCADDPTPLDSQTESCLLQLCLDKRDGSASFSLLPDEEA